MMPEDRLTSFDEGAVRPVQNVQYLNLEDLRKKLSREELQVGKEETEASETQLLNLPFDVLRHIHDHLTLLDYMSFRNVSKLCREVAPTLDIRTAISRSEVQSNSFSPWLMCARDNRRIRFSHPQIVDRYYVEIPEALQGATNWYCKDGWLLIGKQRGENFCLSFFNPFTNDVKSYQEFQKRLCDITSIGFSSPPTSHNCVVVVLKTLDTIEVHICHSREKGWCLFEFYNGDLWLTYKYPVFSNGAFYFLSDQLKVGVLRLQGEGCEWEILEQTPKFRSYEEERFIAERDGEVFLVLRYDLRKRVRVLKLDPSTLNWKSVDNLGNYTLHVSKLSALFTLVKNPQAKNRIYFPRFCGKRIVSYSPSTNSLQSFESTELLDGYKDATMGPFNWIKPTW